MTPTASHPLFGLTATEPAQVCYSFTPADLDLLVWAATHPDPVPQTRSFVLTVRCVVERQIVCEDCTEAEARDDPWSHATDERDMSMPDWKVMDIRPNT
jgi:hypothetical protein